MVSTICSIQPQGKFFKACKISFEIREQDFVCIDLLSKSELGGFITVHIFRSLLDFKRTLSESTPCLGKEMITPPNSSPMLRRISPLLLVKYLWCVGLTVIVSSVTLSYVQKKVCKNEYSFENSFQSWTDQSHGMSSNTRCSLANLEWLKHW